MQLAESSIRHRAAYGAGLSFSMATATFLHFAIAALSPVLAVEFGLTVFQIGVLGAANNGVAALGAPFVGDTVDLFGGRRIAVVLIVVSGLSIIGFGLAPTFAWLVGMTAVNGLAAAGSNPATNQLLSIQIPPGRRGLLMGVKQAGVRVGQFLAGALLPIGAVAFGWSTTMVISGAVCILGVVPFVLAVPSSGRPAPSSGPRERTKLGQAVWRLVLFALLMGTAMSALLLYTPLYAHERLGLSVQGAGLTVGIIGFLGIFARVAAGPFTERFSNPSIPLFIMALGSALATLAVWGADQFGTWLVWLGVGLLGMTGAVWNTVANLAIITTTGSAKTGRASGVLHTAYLAGLSIGPLLFGALIEGTSSYGIAWLLAFLLYVGAVAVTVRWWLVEGRTSVQTGIS